MAEILKRGILPEEVTYDLVCTRCGTLARYKGNEFEYGGSQYNISYYYFVCPLCSHKNTKNGLALDKHETPERHALPVLPENLRTFDK